MSLNFEKRINVLERRMIIMEKKIVNYSEEDDEFYDCVEYLEDQLHEYENVDICFKTPNNLPLYPPRPHPPAAKSHIDTLVISDSIFRHVKMPDFADVKKVFLPGARALRIFSELVALNLASTFSSIIIHFGTNSLRSPLEFEEIEAEITDFTNWCRDFFPSTAEMPAGKSRRFRPEPCNQTINKLYEKRIFLDLPHTTSSPK